MNLQDRIDSTRQKFDQLQAQKQEIDTELVKLQGEYRVLIELQEQEAGTTAKEPTPSVKVKGEKKASK